MARFRLWLHEQIFTRLDGDRERRFVAKSLLVLSFALLLAPALFRAQASTTSAVRMVAPAAGSIVPNPVMFQASAVGDIAGLKFQVFLQNNTSAPVAEPAASFDQGAGLWTAAWNGNPGTAYAATALGVTSSGTSVPAVNAVLFSIPPQQQSLCGNNVCDTSAGETTDSCPVDCPLQAAPVGVAGPVCGNNVCDTGESNVSCPADCPLSPPQNANLCGNNVCDNGETHDSCPNDCPLQVQAATLALDPPVLNQTATDRVNLRAVASGGSILNARFQVSGPNFSASVPAVTANDGSFTALGVGPMPRGATYTIVAGGFSVNGSPISSAPQTIAIPALQNTAPPQSATTTPPVNPLPLGATLLSPRLTADGLPPSFSGPVSMAAGVSNGPAEHVTFRIRNSDTGAGLLGVGTFDASSGTWKFFFETAVAGHYDVSVEAAAGARVADTAPIPFTIALIAAPLPEKTPTPPAGTTPLPNTTPPPPTPPSTATTTRPTTTAPPPPTAVTPLPEIPKACVDAGIPREKCSEWLKLKNAAATAPPPPPAPEPPNRPEEPSPIEATATPEQPPAESASSPTPAPAPPQQIPNDCVLANIPKEKCDEWLAAQFQNKDCLDAGLLTREACTNFLESRGQKVQERELAGFASMQDLTSLRQDAASVADRPIEQADLPKTVSDALSIEVPKDSKVIILRSAAPGITQTEPSAGLMTIDTDGDGLPDDIEKRLGTDPNKADTDGDGFSDGEEVKNGYNPLGPGKLAQEVAPVEKAIIGGKPLEEPRGRADVLDQGFKVSTAETANATATQEAPVIQLAGTAAPDSVVTIYVYSFLPVVVTTTTDANGNWTYDFHSKLADGRHEAYVSVNDDTGKLVKSSSPLSFFIKDAKAASQAEFVSGNVNVQPVEETNTTNFLIAGAVMVLFAVVLVFLIVRQVRKSEHDVQPPANG